MDVISTVTKYSNDAGRHANARPGTAARKKLPLFVTLFIVSLIVPFIIPIGPLRMSAYRFVLILTVLPCAIMWISGRAGKIRAPDIALMFLWLWITLGLTILHGPEVSIEAGGILFIEIIGAYLLGRCFIRDADDYYNMVKLLFWVVAFLLPFAIFEAVTGRNALLEFFNSIIQSFPDVNKEPRWGLRRVQGPFEHPILFGVICGSVLALTYKVLGYRRSAMKKWLKTAVVWSTSFLSLSSGPLTALIAQAALLSYDGLLVRFKARWIILLAAIFAAVVTIEIFSNRSVPAIFISLFAFNTRSAYNRLQIWYFGTESVAKYPMFGVGRDEWERAHYMSTSLDMFWLEAAVRHGLPAALMLHLAFLLIFLGVTFKKGLSERVSQYRTGFLVSMVGWYLSGWTVNYWNATYVLFFFLLGSGAWILDAEQKHEGPPRRRPGSRPDPDPASTPSSVAAGGLSAAATGHRRPNRVSGRHQGR